METLLDPEQAGTYLAAGLGAILAFAVLEEGRAFTLVLLTALSGWFFRIMGIGGWFG